MIITPVSRSIAKVLSDGGTSYRCYSPACPPFYQASHGLYLPMEHEALVTNQLTTGNRLSDIRNKRLVSVGLDRSGNYDKFVGFRYDDKQDGSEQLEFSLEGVVFNGVSVTLLKSDRQALSSLSDSIGLMKIFHDPLRTRLAVPASSSVSSFRISFRIHTVGLTVTQEENQFIFRNAEGKVRYTIGEPLILRPDGTRYSFGRPDSRKSYWFEGTIAHHLEELSKGEYRYIKESTDLFKEMPASFMIDAETVYCGNDVTIGYAGSKSEDWDDVHDATTGTVVEDDPNCFVEVNTKTIYRAFSSFDTSSLVGTVTACSLWLSGQGNGGEIYVQKSDQSAVPAVKADYDAFSGSYYFNASVLSSTNYEELEFNTTGVAGINVGGTTNLCIRHWRDYEDTAPSGQDYIIWVSASGVRKPYLSITLSTFTPRIICVC